MNRSIRMVLFSFVALTVAAPAFALDVVDTSWTVVCLFSPTCSVTVTDHVASFSVSGGSGNGRLQSRIHQAQTGSTAAGKWVYEYRIDFTQVAGVTYPPYADYLAIDSWGAVREYDYNGDGIATDDVYNIVSGGLGTKPVTSAFVTYGTWLYFHLNDPVYAGNYPGGGESSYFFGLVSDRAPVLRTLWVHTDSGWIAATGYAPPV